MSNDLLYQIALTRIPNIGDVMAKALVSQFGVAEDIFKAPEHRLAKIDGMGTVRARCIKTFDEFADCESEIAFIEKYKIQPLFLHDDLYPKRLLNCYDSPILLYFKGQADLNNANIVSIVGTRNNTEYGRHLCEKLIEELQAENVMIVSGLAFGIDAIAHKTSLRHNLPTVGVLAHGLDRVYPTQHKPLAKQMTACGGLLTDFSSGTNPDRQNFPKRNRIVAGMCDALVVIESAIKGGSLITAELANSYNKDVFAMPGRVTDSRSEGCHYLIKNNKASLITGAADLMHLMNWNIESKPAKPQQKELFIELSQEEKTVADILQQQEAVHIDDIYLRSGMSSSAVAAALLTLEMQGVILSMPGKIYRFA